MLVINLGNGKMARNPVDLSQSDIVVLIPQRKGAHFQKRCISMPQPL